MVRCFTFPSIRSPPDPPRAGGNGAWPSELTEERPWTPRERLFNLNPSGTLPVLVDDDGDGVCGVEAITEYLEEQRPLGKPDRLSGTDAVAAPRCDGSRLV